MSELAWDSHGGAFPPTRLSLFDLARRREAPEFRAAWSDFFRAYGPPLYAWLRRTGSDPEQARDLLQDFFLEGLEGDLLKQYDPARGRLRTWLLACLRNFRREDLRRRRVRPEGRGQVALGFDSAALEPVDAREKDPERAFDEEWARRLLTESIAALEARLAAAADERSLRILREWVLADERGQAEVLAVALGITAGDLYTRATRLREAVGEEMEAQVRRTCGDGVEAGRERDELLRALAK